MRILVVGAGGVGTAIARIAARRSFADLVIADYDLARAERAAGGRYGAVRLDARDEAGVAELPRARACDVLLKPTDPPPFSIWTTIEECLNPPVVWEDGGWHTTPPFSEPEVFHFPAGIGPVECVNVEHEEVLLIPRWVTAGRVTFKYGLGAEFIGVLRTLHKLGLSSTEPVRVGGGSVSPGDVVDACLAGPACLGSLV